MNGTPLLDQLRQVQTAMTGPNSTLTCWGDDYTGSRDDFLQQKYRTELSFNGSTLPVLLYPLCLRTLQLGNTLGYYFNDLACAAESGLHFVGANAVFKIQQPEVLEVAPDHANSFLKALTSIWVNPSPRSIPLALRDIKQKCNCLQYCWENKDAPWSRQLDLVANVLNNAVDAYLSHVDSSRGTIVNNSTDICRNCESYSTLLHHRHPVNLTPVPSMHHAARHSTHSHLVTGLPLIPDVAIQYRCGDNVGFGKTRYGLLPFRAISSRIPTSAKNIYILADAPTRNPRSVYSSRCGQIIEALLKHIIARHPSTLVLVKRGGDVFLDVARMARAKTLICSASTFCLWPALANTNVVHYPLTPLVLGAWTNYTAPVLTKSFRWITDFEQIKEFKHFRPWSKLINELENK